MARRRFRRKDLKRPDEFVSRGRQLLAWATGNARLLSWVVGAVVAVALAIAGSFSIRTARVRQANDDLSRALGDYHAGQYSRAATQLADVASRWPSTNAGRIAALYAANADLRADNDAGAATALQDVLNTRDWPAYLQQQALIDLGYALEHKGDKATAAARYAEAAALTGPYTAVAVLGEARMRQQLGEKDKARELYTRFLKEFPDAPEKDLVQAGLDQLQTAS